MRDFLKYMFATVLGIFVAGSILTILGIVSLAGIAASASGTETKVKDNSVFTLALDGVIMERYQPTPIDRLLGEDFPTYGLDDVLASIRKAKENGQIEGIYLDAGMLACAPASLQAIHDALADFKQSGKFIVAYGGNYTQSTYYLASLADKVIVNPSGSIGWHGLASKTLFYKDLLDKIGVEMQVFRVGTYKSAVEPVIASGMSEANREQTLAFTRSVWKQIVADVSAARRIPAEKLNALADECLDFQPAQTYLANGMADTLMYKDEVLSYLKTLAGCQEDEDLNTLSLEDMINVQRDVPKDKSGNIIAVYYAYGDIDGGSSTYEGIDSEKTIKDLRRLREDENVKAVVLRVNSPGGSAYGSEQIWREVALLKEEKPVVVSMGDYAASGGYYISCAADWIVAEPGTLTGSIGIFGMIPNVQKLMNEKLGLSIDGVKTNRFADIGDISRPFDEEEKSLLQTMVDNGYELFTRRCADGRKMTIEEIKRIAEGRVWTGEMAKQLGLVDELGGLQQAVSAAVQRSGVEKYTIVNYPEPESFLSSLLDTGVERYIENRMRENIGGYYDGMLFLKNIEKADKLQALMTFVINIR